MSRTKRKAARRGYQPPPYAVTQCSECSATARCRNRGGGYFCASCENDQTQMLRVGEADIQPHF